MQLTTIDLSIIGAYLLATIAIGLILKRRASKNLDSYLLGGKELPWYMLSLSNASGMFDISGTMWLVTLLFVYGLKSIWIPWMWQRFNRRRMDSYTLWRRYRRHALALHRGGICAGWGFRVFGLRLCRDW